MYVSKSLHLPADLTELWNCLTKGTEINFPHPRLMGAWMIKCGWLSKACHTETELQHWDLARWGTTSSQLKAKEPCLFRTSEPTTQWCTAYPIKLKSLTTLSCKSEDLTLCERFTLELRVIMSCNCIECVTNYSQSLVLMLSHYSLMFIDSSSDFTLLTMHFTAFVQHYMF
jgi:hypothetical protein